MGIVRSLSGRAVLAAALACALLAPLAVHWLAGRTLVWFDTMAFWAPQRWIVDEALREFRLPLWNPYSGAGMPFFADAAHGVLHPVSVLTAWLNTDRSTEVLIGGYVACAGLGAALLARDLGASRAGAVVAGLAYGISGYVLSTVGNLVYLAGAGSLPFCLAGLRRFAVDPGPGGLAFAVGGVAVLSFSGDAQALMVAGALALALAWEGRGLRGAARAALAGTLGLLVAGVQLVATAAHLPRTVRAEGLWSSTPAVWSFEPWRIPELLIPGLVGSADPFLDPVFQALAHPQGLPEGGHPFPFAVSVFVGLLPMALAFVGARDGRRGRLLGVLALVLLWIALGPRFGASAVMGYLPVWKAFRYSEKLVGPLTLLLGMLAGLGLDAVVERRVVGWKLLAGAAMMATVSVGWLRVVSSRLPADLAAIADERVSRGTWHVAMALASLAAWLLAREGLGLSPFLSRSALAVLVWVGMAAASPVAIRPGDPGARLGAPGPALTAAVPGPRIVTPTVIGRPSHAPGADWVGEVARDFSAVGLPAYNVRARIDSLAEYAALPPLRLALLRSYMQDRWPVVARRYAATHLFVDPALGAGDPTLYGGMTDGGTRVGSTPGGDEVWAIPHRGWAAFASGVRTVVDWRAAAVAVGQVVAEGSGDVVVESGSRFSAGPGRVVSVERGLETLRVEAEAEWDATLVIADAWWPGWEATLDGRGVTIFPADALVRAVRWPAGRHVLEMRYRPPEVRKGVLVSVLGVILTVAGIAFLRRKGASG